MPTRENTDASQIPTLLVRMATDEIAATTTRALDAAKLLLELMIAGEVIDSDDGVSPETARLREQLETLLSFIVVAQPIDFRGWFWFGLLRRRQGDRDAALTLFRRAAGCFSGSALSWSHAALLLEEAGQTDEAERYWNAALSAAPDMNAARRRVAQRLRRTQPITAAAHFREMLFYAPRQLYGGSFAAARVEMEQTRRLFTEQQTAEAPENQSAASALWASTATCRREAFLRHAGIAATQGPERRQNDFVECCERYYKGYAIYSGHGFFFAAETNVAVFDPHRLEEIRVKLAAGRLDDIGGRPVLTDRDFLGVVRAVDAAVSKASTGSDSAAAS